MLVGVRFTKVGKIYNFDTGDMEDIHPGDGVIVETARGLQLGWIAVLAIDAKPAEKDEIKLISRKATPQDLVQRQIWETKEEAVTDQCRSKIRDLHLSGVKIVGSEFSFDGSRLIVMYNSDSDEKVDMKAVRQDLQRNYNNVQIEIRQVGPRDMAKCLGGMGACGLENRCCSQFLTDFSSISIRMAKEQGISLTPGEITGMCGRLRCCLFYEYDQYLAAKMDLPRRKQMVNTPEGVGKVIDLAPLRDSVFVELRQDGTKEFHKNDISPYVESEKKEQGNQADKNSSQ